MPLKTNRITRRGFLKGLAGIAAGLLLPASSIHLAEDKLPSVRVVMDVPDTQQFANDLSTVLEPMEYVIGTLDKICYLSYLYSEDGRENIYRYVSTDKLPYSDSFITIDRDKLGRFLIIRHRASEIKYLRLQYILGDYSGSQSQSE